MGVHRKKPMVGKKILGVIWKSPNGLETASWQVPANFLPSFTADKREINIKQALRNKPLIWPYNRLG